MLVSTLDYSSYIGRIAIGRIERGSVRVGERVTLLDLGPVGMLDDSDRAEEAKVSKLFTFSGLERIDVEEAAAGDIVALAGLDGVDLGPDHPFGDGVHGVHAKSVLSRHRGDGAAPEDAERMKGLEIRLYSRTASAVASGDCEGHWRWVIH